jgi:hypothetical protein
MRDDDDDLGVFRAWMVALLIEAVIIVFVIDACMILRGLL